MRSDRSMLTIVTTVASLTASAVLAQAPPAGAPAGQASPPTVSAASLGLFVYAAKNQDPAQQQKDEGE